MRNSASEVLLPIVDLKLAVESQAGSAPPFFDYRLGGESVRTAAATRLLDFGADFIALSPACP